VAVNKEFSNRAKEDYSLVVKAVQEGDQTAYSELMKRYREPVYFTILKMVHNRDDAEDLTIEAFGKAFNNLEKYSPDYAFSTWLFKIATNNCIDYIRKKRLVTTSLDNTLTNDDGESVQINIKDSAPDPEQKILKGQRAEIVRDAVAELKPKYRSLIELLYFKEFSYDEIAEEMNLPLGTVKAQLFRAKEMLLQELKKQKGRY
jgi:RNA polymerase sigma-70 factor (ECF subfamily)